ncbi:MAG: hypothetical protein KDK39_16185 [Leptospiraceae bacterium]|nr:hypothetical protein [Leptospiraceae bacterium]
MSSAQQGPISVSVAPGDMQLEDLRDYYITAEYLERMRSRVIDWTTTSIQAQLDLFQQSIPDYPEVLDILESELHRRRLNLLNRSIRELPDAQLEALLLKYKSVPDYQEVIQTWMAIKSGANRLPDRAAGVPARIQI